MHDYVNPIDMMCDYCGAYWGMYRVYEDEIYELCTMCKEEKNKYHWTQNGPVPVKKNKIREVSNG